MIAVTLARASGLVIVGGIDNTWVIYWQYLSAEVGLLLSSGTAFRTFFVSRSTRRGDNETNVKWYITVLQRLKGFFTLLGSLDGTHLKLLSSGGARQHLDDRFDLPEIPSGNMTGIRTMLGRTGRSSCVPRQLPVNHTEPISSPPQVILRDSVYKVFERV